VGQTPNFDRPLAFWRDVSKALSDGILAGGANKIRMIAAKDYPDSPTFKQFAPRVDSTESSKVARQRAGGVEPAPAMVSELTIDPAAGQAPAPDSPPTPGRPRRRRTRYLVLTGATIMVAGLVTVVYLLPAAATQSLSPRPGTFPSASNSTTPGYPAPSASAPSPAPTGGPGSSSTTSRSRTPAASESPASPLSSEPAAPSAGPVPPEPPTTAPSGAPSTAPPPVSGTGPTASLNLSPIRGTAPLTLTANVSASHPGSTPIKDVTITWDDGSNPDVLTDPAKLVQHRYTSPGNYLIIVTVTDQAGRSGSSKRNITVDAPAPGSPQPGATG